MLIHKQVTDYFGTELPPPIVQTDPEKWLIENGHYAIKYWLYNSKTVKINTNYVINWLYKQGFPQKYVPSEIIKRIHKLLEKKYKNQTKKYYDAIKKETKLLNKLHSEEHKYPYVKEPSSHVYELNDQLDRLKVVVRKIRTRCVKYNKLIEKSSSFDENIGEKI